MSASAPRVAVEQGGSAQIYTVQQGDIQAILYVPQEASVRELTPVLGELVSEATVRVARNGERP